MQRRAISLDGQTRTNGLVVELPASGGLRVDQVPAEGIEIAFDTDATRFPMKEGKKFRRAFRTFRIFHAAGLRGTVVVETFQCDEDIDYSAPEYAGAPGAELAYDVALALDVTGDPATSGVPGNAPKLHARNMKSGDGFVLMDAGAASLSPGVRLFMGGGGGAGVFYNKSRGIGTVGLNPGTAAGVTGEARLYFPMLVAPATQQPTDDNAFRLATRPVAWRIAALLDTPTPTGGFAADSEAGVGCIVPDTSLTNSDSIVTQGGFAVLYRGGSWHYCAEDVGTGGFTGKAPSYIGAALNTVAGFNTFELRVYAATRSKKARVDVIVNNVLAESHEYGSAGFPEIPSTRIGWMPAVWCVNGNSSGGLGAWTAPGLHVAGFRLSAGLTSRSIEEAL